MKYFQKTIQVIFGLLLLGAAPQFSWAEEKASDSFAFIGGNFSTIKDYNYQDKSRLGLGIDGLYLKKVWGGLALGAKADVTFGFGTSDDLGFNNGSRSFAGERKESLTFYSASLVLGGIAEMDNGGRLAYFAGPTIGNRSGDYDITWEPDAASEGLTSFKRSDSDTLYGLTAGAYYKFPGSGWTVGLNATGFFVQDSYSETDFGHRIGLSGGYTF